MSIHKPNHRCPDSGAHFLLVQCVAAALLQLLLVPAPSVYMEFVFNDKTKHFDMIFLSTYKRARKWREGGGKMKRWYDVYDFSGLFVARIVHVP